ncbi:MAG TPA: gluconate 2-dehydrogenase subunit 3 family protein [Cyclobacteriaceae bacterium]|nr:gluconate 2-dehydrogenase subunit 3 family protein [Cyclobacteriaceae bacterium]
MNRRESIKYILIASGSAVAFPGWGEPAEQDILASVADTIIPGKNGMGALAVGVDRFLQRLFDNCYEIDAQENIKKQLAALNANAQSAHQKSFSQCNQQQREALLLRFSDSSDKAEKDFFTTMKSETIRGFNTSKEVMLQHLKYKIAPGHYYGCVDVKA